MKRRDFLKAALLASASTLVPFRAAFGQAKKTITFVPQSDLALLDPVQTTGLVTRNHGMMVFDQLYGLDENFQVQPQMVDGHVISDDGLTWTITLREGMTFHDGAPVTAADAAASVKRWMDSGDALGLDLKNATETLEATSDLVLVFKLTAPFPMLADALAKPSGFCAIMPARLAASTPPKQQVAEIIGSGPFRFVAAERVSGSQAVYEKFEGYKPREGGAPSFTAGPKIAKVDRVVWKTLPDAATASAALQVGEVDWWEQPTPDLIPLLEQFPDIKVAVTDPTGFMPMLRLNHLTPPFDNPAIRRAILPAVDQAAYMTAVMGRDERFWKKDVGFFHPGSPLASAAGAEALFGPADYDAAKRLLDEAGYDGTPVVFVVPTDMHALNSQSLVAADMFQKIGMVVDYQASDWGTVLQRIASQNPIDQGGWSVFANYIPGILGINPAIHSYIRGIGRKGTFGWPTSEEIEALRKRFLAASDPAEQARLAQAIQVQAFQDVPYVPTGLFLQPTAYRGLSGIRSGFSMFYDVEKA